MANGKKGSLFDSARRFGKAVASVAVEFNEPAESKSAATTATETAPKDVPVVLNTTTVTTISENDPAYAELSRAVLDRDSPYTKFLKRLSSLARVKDWDTRYQAALDVLDSEGISKEDILKSISSHVGLLGAEKTTFENTLREHSEESIGALQHENDVTNNTIKGNNAEIARLQALNEKLRKKQDDLQGQIAAAKKKIENAAQSFNAAFATIAKKLEADKSRLLNSP